MPFASGTKIGAYEIRSLIGKGGMGEVYRASDPRLDREVAIKVLTEDLVGKEDALLRFEREAKVLAALSHPNILTVHDIVSERGSLFVVMEFLDGETLRAQINRGAMSWNESVQIGIAIVEGLSAAHNKSVIHRDLKPENVFLTRNGQIKILDFGLARMENAASSAGESWMDTSPHISRPGMILGTLRCMPPEQLRGEPADARSDIFSFGCILYEMVAGHLPFEGKEAAEITAAILRDRPADISANPNAPQALVDLIFRCLEKDAAMRFSSAQEVAAALRSISTDPGAVAIRRPSRGKGKSVAILPIAYLSGSPEDEYLMDGITESIINNLSQLRKLKVTARSTVFRYKRKDIDPQSIGRELNVQTLMTGRGARRGERLEIQAELVSTEDGSQVWGQHFSTNLSDIFTVQEQIATQISAALQKKLTGVEKKLLAKRSTDNIEAYQSYLRGRFHWNKRTPEAFEKAIGYFESAIETDPTYALAYSGIADCYNLLGWDAYGTRNPSDTFPKAIAAATRALDIDDSLAEAYNSLAWAKWAYNHDWDGAEKDYLRALDLNPGYALAHIWYSDLLFGDGRFEESLREIQTAQKLDPLAAIVYGVYGLLLYGMRNYPAAREEARKALELQSDFASGYLLTGRSFLMEGNFEEAIAALEKAVTITGSHPRMRSSLACAYAASGRTAEARTILDEFIAIARRKYVPALTDIALLCAALGENDLAFEVLELAYQQRASLLVWLYPDPLADPLRSDPRFDDLMRRIGAIK